MQPLRLTFELPEKPSAVVTRLRRSKDGQQEVQSLVLLMDGAFHPILGSTNRNGLGVGPQLAVSGGAGWQVQRDEFTEPAWDPYSGSVFFSGTRAVYRLTGGDSVELVVGHPDEAGDGHVPDGFEARFIQVSCLCSDGRGRIFFQNLGGTDPVVKLQLPYAWRMTAAPTASVAAAAAAAAAAAGGSGEGRVLVTPHRFGAQQDFGCVACVPAAAGARSAADGSSLILASCTAVYRVPLNGGGGLKLLAGSEEADGQVDGRGPGARFCDIHGLAACADGSVVVVDKVEEVTHVRRLAPDGDGWAAVTTLTAPLEGWWHTPAILPNGYLALCEAGRNRLLVLDLGLEAPPLALPAEDGSAAAAGPPRRTLHADMGALLDAQPDGTADLILVVGDRRFHAHRAILSARSDYFKQRLAPERFADGAAAELSLPDADPAAFELLLRFLYSGSTDIPASLAPSVAELADRLLLPELCSDAQAVVLSGVCAATVVGSLLWADRLGGSFSGVLSSLKTWYLEHQEEVHEAAPESLERLSVEGPGLMVELLMETARSAKHRNGR